MYCARMTGDLLFYRNTLSSIGYSVIIGALFISACGGTDYNCCSEGDGACGDGGGHCQADNQCQGDLNCWGFCQQSTAPPSGHCCMAGRESFINS